jgi:hypothetical protein
MSRKITFPVVSTAGGVTIRRNSETGVEIHSVKLDRGGYEHSVYVPRLSNDGMRFEDWFGELSNARARAFDEAEMMREVIAEAYDAAAKAEEQGNADIERAMVATVLGRGFTVEGDTYTHPSGVVIAPAYAEFGEYEVRIEGHPHATVTYDTFAEAADEALGVAYSLGSAIPAAAEAEPLTERARKQFPSVAAMLDAETVAHNETQAPATVATIVGRIPVASRTGLVAKMIRSADTACTPFDAVKFAQAALDLYEAEGTVPADAVAPTATEFAPVTEHLCLNVRFRDDFSEELRGMVFEVDTLSRRAAEGGYRFVGIRVKLNGRWRYRLAKLDDLRTVDGRRVTADPTLD